VYRRCPVSDIAKHMGLCSRYLSGRKNAKYKCLVLDLDLAARTSDRSAGIVCGALVSAESVCLMLARVPPHL